MTFFRFAPLFIPFFILGVPIVDTAFAIVATHVSPGRASPSGATSVICTIGWCALDTGTVAAVLILWTWTAVLCALVLVADVQSTGQRLRPLWPRHLGHRACTPCSVHGPAALVVSQPRSRCPGRDRRLDAVLARHRHAVAPVITVSLSGSVGVAVAGEPDLASPRSAPARFAKSRASSSDALACAPREVAGGRRLSIQPLD